MAQGRPSRLEQSPGEWEFASFSGNCAMSLSAFTLSLSQQFPKSHSELLKSWVREVILLLIPAMGSHFILRKSHVPPKGQWGLPSPSNLTSAQLPFVLLAWPPGSSSSTLGMAMSWGPFMAIPSVPTFLPKHLLGQCPMGLSFFIQPFYLTL